jgi:hypothetical protein
MIDHDMAMAWCPFYFKSMGSVDACGDELFYADEREMGGGEGGGVEDLRDDGYGEEA